MISEGELLAGRYRLVAQVGTGAMGVVWQAHDERLDRMVAVKQLLWQAGTSESEAEEANRRAMREARLTARLHHPHAITVYNVAEHDGTPCLIMEYLHSQSLATVLDERGPLPLAQVARIGSQIAAALAAAHEAGIVHRDVKPGNVLLADDGTAKITDFGISRAVGDGTLTANGILVGTPAYLAPEVARGQPASFPADVFSLGSTLYAALEGVPPFGFDDNHLALVFRITHSEITPPRKAGPLTPVLIRLLERDPRRRLTMAQAQEALTEAATAAPAVAAPTVLTVSPVPRTPVTPSGPTTVDVSPFSVADPSATAAPPLSADAPTPRTAQAGDIPALWPRVEGTKQSRRSTATIAAVTTLLFMAGLMFVATLLNNGSNPVGRGVDPPSTPATAQNQQAPQRSPNAGSNAGAAPILAPSPKPLVPSPEPPIPALFVPSPAPRMSSPEPPVPSPTPTLLNPAPRVPSPAPPVPSSEPPVPSSEPPVPSPAPPVPSSEPPVPSPAPPVPSSEPPLPSSEPIPTPDTANPRALLDQLRAFGPSSTL